MHCRRSLSLSSSCWIYFGAGVIINDMGLEGTIDRLLRDVLQPIAATLYPLEGRRLDKHHSFVVQYTSSGDRALDMHTDDSDVTFNVCLGKQFKASTLTFCGVLGAAMHRQLSAVYEHVKGQCCLHLGRHRHGADELRDGERLNLIVWSWAE